ncbi:partial acetolactate synthase I/II/III large subunit, partial [Anaerolineae bacterium]
NPLRCSEENVARAGRLLLEARAPVIVAGREVIQAGCTNLVQALAEITGIPVATTVGQPDAFPNTHPLGVGPVGQWGGWDPANKLVASADLVFAIGERFEFDMSAVRYAYGVVSPTTRIVQVNRFPGSLGAVYPLELGIISDLTWFMETLLNWLRGQAVKPRVTQIAELKRAWDQKRYGLIDAGTEPIQPEFVMQEIRRLARPNAVISSEVGKFLRQIRPYFDTYAPNTMLYAENFACLGSALPMLLGAKVGLPDRQMICLCGDGGFTFNAAEIETAVREKLNVTVVIFNDQCYGSIRAIQKNRYGRVVGADFGEVDFAAMARSLGAHGQAVTRPVEFEDALIQALPADKPAVLDVRIRS